MLVLDPQLLGQLQAYDPSIEVHFNSRLYRWVVCQRTQKWYAPTESLNGVQEAAGREKLNLKHLFTCQHPTMRTESGKKIPLEPTFEMIRETLEEHYPPRQTQVWVDGEGKDPYSKHEKAMEEAEARRQAIVLDELHDEFKTDRETQVIRDRTYSF